MLDFEINVLYLKDQFNLESLSLELMEALEHMTDSSLSTCGLSTLQAFPVQVQYQTPCFPLPTVHSVPSNLDIDLSKE